MYYQTSPARTSSLRKYIPAAACIGVVLLCILFFSVGNHPQVEKSNAHFLARPKAWDGSHSIHPQSAYSNASHLIMVACHGVYTSNDFSDVSADAGWFLEPYQTGQAESFVKHIRIGVEIASQDPNSILLFSGGQTRKQAGPRTEAGSYWMVADSQGWFGSPEVRDRALTEDYARDSYENLMFSLCRFKELTGQYPWLITVVSMSFKKRRFSELHRLAIRWPAERFAYAGADPKGIIQTKLLEGERTSAFRPFQQDPYGCRGLLLHKKQARDPFVRTVPYVLACPDLAELLTYCGSEPYLGPLPWDPLPSGEAIGDWGKITAENPP